MHRLGLLTLVVAAIAFPSVASARGSELQTPQTCVRNWNTFSSLAAKMAVARRHPLRATVIGTGVLVVGAAPRCSLLFMMSNGQWYATETPCKPGAIEWSPLTRLQDGLAATYEMPNTAIATVRSTGKIALST